MKKFYGLATQPKRLHGYAVRSFPEEGFQVG
jgi:hypothetical protein